MGIAVEETAGSLAEVIHVATYNQQRKVAQPRSKKQASAAWATDACRVDHVAVISDG